jgi:hypothetical protein
MVEAIPAMLEAVSAMSLQVNPPLTAHVCGDGMNLFVIV